MWATGIHGRPGPLPVTERRSIALDSSSLWPPPPAVNSTPGMPAMGVRAPLAVEVEAGDGVDLLVQPGGQTLQGPPLRIEEQQRLGRPCGPSGRRAGGPTPGRPPGPVTPAASTRKPGRETVADSKAPARAVRTLAGWAERDEEE